MANTHSYPDSFYENQATWGDLGPQVIVSHSGLTVPASSLTMPGVSANGYALSPGPPARLVYVSQPAVSVTLPSTAATYWLAVHADLHTPVSGWTRRSGSHFLFQASATQPANPAGALVFASVVVAGAVITTVTPLTAVTSAPMSRQNSNAVAITGGVISLGGHAPTGVLDVQGSVQASDAANNYYGARVWPVAPAGAVTLNGIRIEAATGAAVGTASHYGVIVQNAPTTTGFAVGMEIRTNDGANRYGLYCSGTAPSYFGGTIQTVGHVGINAFPDANMLHIRRPDASPGIRVQPTQSDAAAWAMAFANLAGTIIGTISTTGSATAYNTSSDVRLKEAIVTLTGALDVIRALRPVSFRWQADQSPGEGFLAHELQQHIPLAVTGLPDEVNPDGSIKPQQVDHSRLIVHLVGAVQELAAQVAALTTRLETLETALGG